MYTDFNFYKDFISKHKEEALDNFILNNTCPICKGQLKIVGIEDILKPKADVDSEELDIDNDMEVVGSMTTFCCTFCDFQVIAEDADIDKALSYTFL